MLVRAGLLFASASAVAAHGQVWNVDDDGGPGVDFIEIQAAVDGAGEGDTIVVQSGTYPSFAIEAKSLVVTAARDADVLVANPVTGGGLPTSAPASIAVRDLSAAQRVHLRGFELAPPVANFTPEGVPGLVLEDDAGEVWIEECVFYGNSNLSNLVGILILGASSPAGLVDGCAGVVLSRCEFTGGIPDIPEFEWIQQDLLDDLHGLVVRDSNVAAYDCTFVGSYGAVSDPCGPLPVPGSPIVCCGTSARGGDGVHVESGSFYAAGCELRGGDASEELDPLFDPRTPGDPGDGLEVVAPTAQVRLLDCTLSPGLPGQSEKCGGSAPASALVAPPGTVTTHPARAFSLRVDSPLDVGVPGTLSFAGDPGDLLFLAVSGSSVQIPVPSFQGVLHVALPGLSVFAGVTPAASTLDLPLTLGPLDPAVDATVFLLQSVALTVGGSVVLGAPTALVGLD